MILFLFFFPYFFFKIKRPYSLFCDRLLEKKVKVIISFYTAANLACDRNISMQLIGRSLISYNFGGPVEPILGVQWSRFWQPGNQFLTFLGHISTEYYWGEGLIWPGFFFGIQISFKLCMKMKLKLVTFVMFHQTK